MRKRNIISIIIMNLFMTSLFFGLNFSIDSNEQENINDEIITNPTNDTPVESPSITTTPEGWSERETINVKYDPKDRFISKSRIFFEYSDQEDTPFQYGLLFAMKDDSVMYRVGVYDDSENDEAKGDINFFFKSDSLSGTLYYDFFVKVFGSPNSQSPYYDSTFEITDDYADGEGFLNVLLQFHGLPTERFARIIIFNFETNNFEVIVEDQTAISLTSVNYCFVYIDELRFSPDVISSNIKSTYQYTSNTIKSHKLSIPSFDYNTEITIYKPLSWTYSSINPSCIVTPSADDIILTNTVPTTYEMFFTSNSTYLLAIEEKTSSLLLGEDLSFENGLNFLVADYGTFPSSAEIKTDISFDGYHSLYCSESGTYYLTFPEDLPSGAYYFSMWYYIEETAGTSRNYFYWKDFDDIFQSETVFTESSITNRWLRFTHYFEQLGNTDELMFKLSFGSTTSFYTDCLQFFEVSTEISTTDLDEYEISSSFICWDGYSNPALTNEEITLELWDRTAQTELSDYETITNSLGVATWTYEGSLSQKEYLVRVWTENNRFGDFWQMNYGYSNDFDDGSSHLSYVDKGACDSASGVVENGYFNLKMNHDETASTTYCWAKWEFDDYDDISNLDELTGIVRVREVLDEGGNPNFYFRGNTDPNTELHDIHLFNLTTIGWTDCLVNKDDWSYDYCNTDMMFLIRADEMASADDFSFEYHFDFILLVEDSFFSEFYFTPSYPYNVDYAGEELADEWDFSEGDFESFTKALGTWDFLNGYLLMDTLDTSTYLRIDSSQTFDFSEQYYTKAIVRFLINETDTDIRIRVKSSGNDVCSDYYISSADTWYVVEFDISTWDDIDNKLSINLRYTNIGLDIHLKIDFIRLVHVEEPETFLTNTYLGFVSENDKWISAVYSDNIFLGFYNDPNLVYLNQTLGTHNISRLPVARQGETKAFLYSNIYTYTYQVSEPDNYFILLNPPSYDISAGLIYLDIVTYYNNCTYRVMMNETWLGSNVSEGSSVWECDFSSAGFYNFTVYVYQGAEVWSTLTSSITIPSTEEESLQLLIMTKDVDTSVSQIFVNYYSNWENTTLIVFDNTTQLGTELSGEGASIWSFANMEYYAFHNISICIYHNSVLQFIYYFSFTIQEPALEPENYYILLNPPSFDIDAGLIYIDLVTYYGNCTYRVMMNETFLGNAVGEGSSVWECDFSSAGFYNFTVFVYQGAEVWSTLTSSITIAKPALPEGLIIEIWNKDVDVAAGLIYINVITSWGNQSVRLQDNETFLGDYASEGASIWLFPTTFGLHNISIWLYNGLTPMFVEYFSFTIQEPSLEIFTVHFDLFTIAGIGLPFETAKIYVNDFRIYNPQQYYLEDSFIEVKVRDYYNHLLFATNVTITANRDIALYVRLFMQQIRNTYDIPVEVYFISTFDSNYNHSYIVAAEGSISVLLFSSSYHILVKPLQDEYQNSTHITYFYATTSEYQDLGDETKSYSITMETDLEPLDLEEPKGVRTWPAWVLLANSIIINAILISFIGAMGKWGIVKIWNYGLYYPNKGANWVLRKFGSEKELHWCVEHKGGLEFVTPEQYEKAEALKEEGKF
ncbi:MAG: hypothetical protein HZR80_21200 [Candidatus Heimdallarchaeota archaeon]